LEPTTAALIAGMLIAPSAPSSGAPGSRCSSCSARAAPAARAGHLTEAQDEGALTRSTQAGSATPAASRVPGLADHVADTWRPRRSTR
jgi:hypothetical protein